MSRYVLGWLALAVTGLTAGAVTYEVNVFDHFFEPFELSIHTGDTVEWVAYGYGHIVLSDTGVFDSSMVLGSAIPALRSFKFTFHESGFFPYYSVDYGGPEASRATSMASTSSGPMAACSAAARTATASYARATARHPAETRTSA